MTIPKRNLGRVGPVSALGFGCMRLPMAGPNPADVDADEAVRMIRRAIDAGVDYVDTAYPYHGNDRARPGESEPVLARALRDGYRERVKVATKLPLWLVQTRADMDRLLDEQLRRLEVSALDVYLAHNVNSSYWGRMLELDIGSFFAEAKKDGRIRHAGFSFHDALPLFRETLDYHDWDVVQIQYNYVDQDYQAGRTGLRDAAARGMGVIIMEPLRGGFLVNQLPRECRDLLAAARPEWSLPAWALGWLWDQPEVGVVLSGMSAMPQLEENLAIAAQSRPGMLSGAERRALDAVREHFTARIRVNCTACGYCLPCPAGVAIPKIFAYYNDSTLSDEKAVKDRAKFMYTATVGEHEKADRCVRCGVCVEKCPQHIAIPETMADAATFFNSPN